MTPMFCRSTSHHQPCLGYIVGQQELGSALGITLHLTVNALTASGLCHQSITPACLRCIDVAIAGCSGPPLEVYLDGGAALQSLETDDIEAIVLGRTLRRNDVTVIGSLYPVEGSGKSILIILATVAQTVDVPGDGMAGEIENHPVEIILRQTIHTLIGLHRVFGIIRLTPQPTDKVGTMQLAPVILDEIVGITGRLMQESAVDIVYIFAIPIVGEERGRIDLECLPLGTALPPAVAAAAIAAEAPLPAMGSSQVGTHQILEHMPHLMSHRMTALGLERPGIAVEEPHLLRAGLQRRARIVTHRAILTGTIGTP